MLNSDPSKFQLLNPRPEHFQQIQELCKKVYPFSKPWSIPQLESHRAYFPDGQLIVIDRNSGTVVGLAFSLIIAWDDYSHQDNWLDFTSSGFFHNHNPRRGKTLYGAEVMVDPESRGQGIGKLLYQGRQEIADKYHLKRIRAGARLRGYSRFKDKLTPEEYVRQVTRKEIYDPTLSFQLAQGFVALDVAKNYLFNDPESLGYAAVIEWLNPKVATAHDFTRQQEVLQVFMTGQRFIPEFLPKELRRLVRKATLVLGEIIKETEGDRFYKKVEYYRERLKFARTRRSPEFLQDFFEQIREDKQTPQLKLAHAFSLQLEIVNVCESAYRSWRLRQRTIMPNLKRRIDLTFVLTAHPTEARPPTVVSLLARIQAVLMEGLESNFIFDEDELHTQIRTLWHHSLAKTQSPAVKDEAEYIYSLIFRDDIVDFLLREKPNYTLKLRTWVGGDKDGHPGVNQRVMIECLTGSRVRVLQVLNASFQNLLEDLKGLEQVGKIGSKEVDQIKKMQSELTRLKSLVAGDGTKIKTWTMKFRKYLKGAPSYIKKHAQMKRVSELLQLFPALVLPLELREDSAKIAEALSDKNAPIRLMLGELQKTCGNLEITAYARGLVISNCATELDIQACVQLVDQTTKTLRLPVIPLFESKEALRNGRKILRAWLSDKKNLERVNRHWNSRLEIMLGYSDSAKELGALASRHLIRNTMKEIESALKSLYLKPVFFHGSGGSVARGGGSIKEQISWWSNSAVESPKMTIQGEMIQRIFATSEILNSQCSHLTNETSLRKTRKGKEQKSHALEMLVAKTEREYSSLINDKNRLNRLLGATPYRYLDVLRLGSRPSKRPESGVSVESLRAIPWILCWTQARVLMPAWWGIGTAWSELSAQQKQELRDLFASDPFFSSFVKIAGYTLSKVELDVWELYFRSKADHALLESFRLEFSKSVAFVRELSGQSDLIWYRPWLQESIRLRSPHIHILNFLQIIALERGDENLLRESIVGIACGMMTTG